MYLLPFSTTRLSLEMLNVLGFLRTGPKYIIFVGMNILKTLQQLEAVTKRFFWKINVLKISQNFDTQQQIWAKTSKNTY